MDKGWNPIFISRLMNESRGKISEIKVNAIPISYLDPFNKPGFHLASNLRQMENLKKKRGRGFVKY